MQSGCNTIFTSTADEGSEEIDGSLVALLQKDEIVRKVTQIFCLERLASGDTITARTLLANIVAVCFRSRLLNRRTAKASSHADKILPNFAMRFYTLLATTWLYLLYRFHIKQASLRAFIHNPSLVTMGIRLRLVQTVNLKHESIDQSKEKITAAASEHLLHGLMQSQ